MPSAMRRRELKKVVPLERASPTVETIVAALDRRLKARQTAQLGRYSRAVRRDAAVFWSERAWSEYAALPALAQVLLLGVKAKAPLGETAALSGILHDEALHTGLSKQLAEAFDVYVPEVPSYLAFDPQALANATGLPLEQWLVSGGCVGETISRALIQARLKVTRDPLVRAVTLRTLKDENLHVAFTWAAAERILRPLPKAEKRRLVDRATATVQAAFVSQCTEGLRGAGLRAERNLRSRVARAGLGSLDPDEENRVVRACIERTIVPQLERLGFSYGR